MFAREVARNNDPLVGWLVVKSEERGVRSEDGGGVG
jgi:hypothetical protein